MKKFNVNGVCYPDRHYMADIHGRLQKIKELVDAGDYFVINRARQYGKTTTLWALKEYLKETYLVVFINFQQLSENDYRDEYAFASAFADVFLDAYNKNEVSASIEESLSFLQKVADGETENIGLRRLFKALSQICVGVSGKIVLLIDEVDSASNNQVFLDFLAQLRAYYLSGDRKSTFWSVILAGVYDIRNLKLKMHPDLQHKYNSPWNTHVGNEPSENEFSFGDCPWDQMVQAPFDIAAEFNVDMSLKVSDIAGMLEEYEGDHCTGMNVSQMAELIYDYTSGYPFLVSRLCKLLDENIAGKERISDKTSAWTKNGLAEAVKLLLAEPNTLFDDMVKKIYDLPELRKMLYAILFQGDRISYNIDNHAIRVGSMFGFVKNINGNTAIANRIFETRLYNLFLSEEMLNSAIYKAADVEKNLFVSGGQLNMELILERFVQSFTDIYSDAEESFLEENGRRFFLLYLKPIINGVGNYYIESRTRDLRRTDIIIDYHGKQYVCEMKIWHGEEYNRRGEKQLLGYLEDYHLTTGYMVSFNFNKNKKPGIRKIRIGEKELIEAVV